MFANAYQNGPYLQIWDSKVNVQKNTFYQQLFRVVPNSIKKYFDKQAKCYLYSLQGQTTKMLLPAQDNKNLCLHQRYLIFQIFIPIGYAWFLQISMSDLNAIKRRVYITTNPGKQQIKYFSIRYPVDNLKKGIWLFLAIDIYSFMKPFKNQVIRSLDQITVGSNCRLRRIFTMKQFVEWEIPKNYWLSNQIAQEFQLIEYNDQSKLSYMEISKQLTESNSSPKKVEKSVSIKKQISQSNNTSIQIIRSQNQFENKKSFKNIAKSQIIIQNARAKLNQLQKKEEEIVNRFKQLKPISKIKNIKQQKHGVKQEKPQVKLPLIEKSFKQDDALNYQQSSNFTIEQKQQVTPRVFQSREQVIEEDKWSDSERMIHGNTPISQSISTLNGNFPSTVITKQNKDEVMIEKQKTNELQLIYDQMVGVYYHPQTNTYYDLKQ